MKTVWRMAAVVVLVLSPLISSAQEAKPARIGLMVVTARTEQVNAFKDGLSELGYVEGRNLVIEFRSAEGHTERLPALAAELVALGVDIIVTHTTPGVRAARKATSTIPIVMANVGNAVESGHVESIARPGGNVTGNSFFGAEMAVKRIEILKEAVPSISRMALLSHPAYPEHARRGAVATVESLGLEAQIHYASGASEFEAAFEAMKQWNAGGLVVLASSVYFAERGALVEQAARHGMPAIYPWSEAVEEGGLMAYGPDFNALYRRAAVFVDKILKGANPATLPVEQATEFDLIVNRNAAKAIGISIPRSILLRASEVIE